MKNYLVHRAQTIQCVSVRIILIVAKIKDLRIWVVDAKLRYLLSNKPLIRKIFITDPASELELSAEEYLQLHKPMNGLADSVDEQHGTLDDNVQIDLNTNPIIIDPSLYCQFEDYQIVRINGSYVDDLLRAGTDSWKIQSNATLERFEKNGNRQVPFTFAGMRITDFDNKDLIDQDSYMSKIEQIPFCTEFSKFDSIRIKLATLTNVRAGIVLDVP